MNNSIPHLDIKALTSAIGADDWKPEEFLIFEGPIPAPKWYTPVRAGYYALVCIESGVMRINIDLRYYEIKKNDMLIVRPSQIMQVESISPDTRGRMIAFDKSFLAGEHGQLFEQLALLSPTSSPVLSLRHDEACDLPNTISHIKRKVEDIHRPHRRQIAINLIRSFLLEIDTLYDQRNVEVEKTFSRKEQVNTHFLSLLSEHFLQERTVIFYADLLNITPNYLTELTKEFTGKTAGDLIDDRVILEAKVLLKNPDLTIKSIAEMLNFSDQFFFSKYFKNSTGISPSAYRGQDA
jgi:AraC-like DNA-binding protein